MKGLGGDRRGWGENGGRGRRDRQTNGQTEEQTGRPIRRTDRNGDQGQTKNEKNIGREGKRKWQREREGGEDTDRQTGRQTDRDRQRQRQRQTDRDRQRQRDGETETERQRDRDRHTDIQRRGDKQTDRKRKTDGRTDKHTDSQTHYVEIVYITSKADDEQTLQ